MKNIKTYLCFIMAVLMMVSCDKNNILPMPVNETYPYEVRITDAPGPYDAVYVDIQGVEITGSNGKTALMNVHTGIYNLLNFSNGIDTLLARVNLTDNKVSQIRLILGSNNSVVVSGVSYPLSTPSAEQSGLKLQVHQTLQAGVLYSILLDFDANQSVAQTGNGTYKLKPVIRTIETATSGSIRGAITPVGVSAFITATSNASYSSNATASGQFLLMGIPPGMYSVTIYPGIPYAPVTIGNVNVIIGVSTNLGTINL